MSPKLSIIHNLYKRNEYVNESVNINLKALIDANIDFQYILFNDNKYNGLILATKIFGNSVL